MRSVHCAQRFRSHTLQRIAAKLGQLVGLGLFHPWWDREHKQQPWWVLQSRFSKLLQGWRLNWPNCVCLQGIDLKAGGRNKKTARTAPKSDNVYLKLLVKVGWSSSNSTKPSCPCC